MRSPADQAQIAGLMARHLDHTMLKPSAIDCVIREYRDARDEGCASFVTHSRYLRALGKHSIGRPTLLSAVIDFPFGLSPPESKIRDIEHAIEQGAEELEIVINLADSCEHRYSHIREELSAIAKISLGLTRKVIVETAYQTDESLRTLGEIIVACGFEFIKTSTGFAHEGATVHAVGLLRDSFGSRCGIKASGGIATLQACLSMLRAGATRIGTSKAFSILSEIRDLDVTDDLFQKTVAILSMKGQGNHVKEFCF